MCGLCVYIGIMLTTFTVGIIQWLAIGKLSFMRLLQCVFIAIIFPVFYASALITYWKNESKDVI